MIGCFSANCYRRHDSGNATFDGGVWLNRVRTGGLTR